MGLALQRDYETAGCCASSYAQNGQPLVSIHRVRVISLGSVTHKYYHYAASLQYRLEKAQVALNLQDISLPLSMKYDPLKLPEMRPRGNKT